MAGFFLCTVEPMNKNLISVFTLLFFTLSFIRGAFPDDKDMLYEYRIAQLNKLSPIALDYNSEVRRYIDLYTGSRKDDMARIIGLSHLYFPIFDEMLDKYSLPHELKYLTIIESGLNPLPSREPLDYGSFC
jgi:hypothetical protein